MSRREIELKLAGNSEWKNESNARARVVFVRLMRGRQYGLEPLLDAWNWFVVGWKARHNAD
jgi:hypothetical protein